MSEVTPEAPVVVPVEAPAEQAPEAAPPATPVVAQAPSSSVVHEVVADVEQAVVSVEDAVRKLIALVKEHRTAGDSDVSAAIDAVQAALAAKL